jgi:ribonuclease PH
MIGEGLIERSPIRDGVAAVSCGIVNGVPVCDLNYFEDSRAEADMNVVMSHGGGIIEVQCTGEKRPLERKEFDALLRLAETAATKISAMQIEALESGV